VTVWPVPDAAFHAVHLPAGDNSPPGIAVFDRQRGDRDAERRGVMGIKGLGCLSNGLPRGLLGGVLFADTAQRSSGLAGKEASFAMMMTM